MSGTHIITILDKSGSMNSKVRAVIEGYNNFLEDQKQVTDESVFSLYVFNTQTENIINAIPLQDVEKLSTNVYYPNGGTALLDAIGHVISEHESEPKVLVQIITDGEENSSCNYTASDIQALVKFKERTGWAFIYMGAGSQAFLEAEKFGFKNDNVQQFSDTNDGFTTAYASSGIKTRGFRLGGDYSNAAVEQAFESQLESIQAAYGSAVNTSLITSR